MPPLEAKLISVPIDIFVPLINVNFNLAGSVSCLNSKLSVLNPLSVGRLRRRLTRLVVTLSFKCVCSFWLVSSSLKLVLHIKCKL